MKKIFYYLIAILLIIPFVWGININEIMYNPLGSDNNYEFVEVIGTNNLSGYTIGDLASNDSLEMLKFVQGNISLVVEEGFNYSDMNCSVYSAGSTIGNNLNNGEDTVFLYHKNILIDFVGYDGSLANDNGYSLEFFNNSWRESCLIGGSPGERNCFFFNETINESVNITINETNSTEEEQENSSETPNFSINSCFVNISLSTDKEIYQNNEKVKIMNDINNKSIPYIIEYWVEDLFGEEVKKRYNTSNTNQKTYTPNIEEKDRVFLVKNRLVYVACDNSNTELENEKMIIVINVNQNSTQDNQSTDLDPPDSTISIGHIYVPTSNLISFGSSFKVKLNIHKGDTTRSVVNVYVKRDDKKVSLDSKFYLNKKNYDYNLTVLVFLKPNCNDDFADGKHILVAEGLGGGDEEELTIEGNKKGICIEELMEKLGKINSFYTRSKNYMDLINLYANIDAKSANQAVLIGKKTNQTIIINGSNNLKFAVEPEPGKNIFLLELRKDKEMVDTKTLVFNLKGEEKTAQILKNPLFVEKENQTSEELNASISINQSMEEVTGGVVYESKNIKIAKNIPYVLVFVFTLIIIGLLLSKRR